MRISVLLGLGSQGLEKVSPEEDGTWSALAPFAKLAGLSAQEVSALHGPCPQEPSSAHEGIHLPAPANLCAVWTQQRVLMQSHQPHSFPPKAAGTRNISNSASVIPVGREACGMEKDAALRAGRADRPESGGGGSRDLEGPPRQNAGQAERTARGQTRHHRRGKLGVGRTGTSKVPSRYCETIGPQSKMGLV